MTWTDVGQPQDDGIQGRYLIPIAAFAGLGLPLLPRLPNFRSVGRVLAWGPVAMGAIGIGMLPAIVVYRYYIG